MEGSEDPDMGVNLYEIRVKGQVAHIPVQSITGFRATALPNGETVLSGQVKDQAVLQSVLKYIYDLGLILLKVERKDSYHFDEEAKLPAQVFNRVVSHLNYLEPQNEEFDLLTEREQEVLKFLDKGLRYKQIGRTLNISDRTVEYHVKNILHKLEVKSRSEAVAAARERGWLI